jgi:hypothetical protein
MAGIANNGTTIQPVKDPYSGSAGGLINPLPNPSAAVAQPVWGSAAAQGTQLQQNANQTDPASMGGGFNDNAMQRPAWWNEGESGPPGSPDFVRNPKSEQNWIDRYNWLQQNQNTAYTQQTPINAWYQRDDPTANTYLNSLAAGQIGSYNGMDSAGAKRQLLSWDAERQGGQLEPGSQASPAGRYHMPDGQIIDVAAGKPVGYDPGSSGFKAQQGASSGTGGASSGTGGVSGYGAGGEGTTATPPPNYMTGQAPSTPLTYTSAQGQAWSGDPTTANLVKLWQARGMTADQIKQSLIQSGINPDTGQPMSNAGIQAANYIAQQQAAIKKSGGLFPWLAGK